MAVCIMGRAFVNADGVHGNPALVIVEPPDTATTPERQRDLAVDLAIPATVFVRDAANGRMSICSSYGRLIRFGGHPLLAAAQALHHLGFPITSVAPSAGRVPCRRDQDGTTWLTAPDAWSIPWRHYQMESPSRSTR